MITIYNGIIELHTKDSSYILGTSSNGLVENLYYGAKINMRSPSPLEWKVAGGFGGDVVCKEEQPALSSLGLEFSPVQRGDYRKSALLVQMPHGGMTSDFVYKNAIIREGSVPAKGMPHGRNGDKTVELFFADTSGVEVELLYTIYYNANVITKRMRITNRSQTEVALKRCMSQQLDLPHSDYTLHTLQGAWARECELIKQKLQPGTLQFGNNTGASGNRCNPFFFLAENEATEKQGDVYGFNLIYSGSHEASVEVDQQGCTRVMNGMSAEGFNWKLPTGEMFETPEAVLSFSNQGKTGLSHNMHFFVTNHILPPVWSKAPRPILANNWEGTYFRFNENKLLRMAKEAAKAGVELFVLDDGWFGERNSDKAGLGDYNVNVSKLPSGLHGLANKLKQLGLNFGLWVEPEMVNANSNLFRTHPDWIVKTPGYTPCLGRNQYVLDLCQPEVREYITQSLQKIIESADIRYIKWDMNRHISDVFSTALDEQGEFFHRYILGLYEILQNVVERYPKILFEGCSSGGNRFDLGMLFYMPQIWASDNTDAHQRQRIQTGLSYGYPLCTMGCHVSAVPNHQTLRSTPLETRFNTACFGVLGYELDFTQLSKQEKTDIAQQISFYKKQRSLFQQGSFYRLKTPFESSTCTWMVVSADKRKAILADFTELYTPNKANPPVRLMGLIEERMYEVKVRQQKIGLDTFGSLINYVLPVQVKKDGLLLETANKLYRLTSEEESYVAYGNLLQNAGIRFKQDFSGSAFHKENRIMPDFASRLYTIDEVVNNELA